jgi:hypothetical protein
MTYTVWTSMSAESLCVGKCARITVWNRDQPIAHRDRAVKSAVALAPQCRLNGHDGDKRGSRCWTIRMIIQ